MTPDEAADLAARTLAAIDARSREQQDRLRVRAEEFILAEDRQRFAIDRERVASDLRAITRAEEGLARHAYGPHSCTDGQGQVYDCPDARRYAEARDDAWADLRRTAALYGVTA